MMASTAESLKSLFDPLTWPLPEGEEPEGPATRSVEAVHAWLKEVDQGSRIAWTMCSHLNNIEPVAPHTTVGCEDCLRSGSQWVHLRLCLSCGHVGCCDNSPQRHATKHFRTTGDPIVASFEPGERWAWCYADEEELPVPPDAEQFLR